MDTSIKHITDKFYKELFYSGTDVGIYIGKVWVDDIISIQYTLTNNKTPVYSYMSEAFNGVARGTYIVEGQFALAFREAKYLRKVLNEFKKAGSTKVYTGVASLPLADIYGEHDFNVRDVDPQTTEIRTLLSDKLRPDRFEYDDLGYTNSVGYGFDIFITYGDTYEEYREGTAIMLSDCHITSESIVAQPTGDPIAIVYSFFSKTVTDASQKFKYHSTVEEPEDAKPEIPKELTFPGMSKQEADEFKATLDPEYQRVYETEGALLKDSIKTATDLGFEIIELNSKELEYLELSTYIYSEKMVAEDAGDSKLAEKLARESEKYRKKAGKLSEKRRKKFKKFNDAYTEYNTINSTLIFKGKHVIPNLLNGEQLSDIINNKEATWR